MSEQEHGTGKVAVLETALSVGSVCLIKTEKQGIGDMHWEKLQ